MSSPSARPGRRGTSALRPTAGQPGPGRRASTCIRPAISANGARRPRGVLQPGERVAGAGQVERGARDQVAEHTDAVHLLDDQPVPFAEPADQLRCGACGARRGVEQLELALRAGQVTGQGPAQHGGHRVVDQHAEQAAGQHAGGHRGEGVGDRSDRLEDAVGQNQVEALPVDRLRQRLDIALQRTDPIARAGLGGPPAQRGQRVDADVDHVTRAPAAASGTA